MAPLTTGAIKAILQEISQQSVGRGRYARGGGVGTYAGASGGVISDYLTPPGTRYRAHIFTSSGTFTVTDPSLTSVEYLVVGGGGSGGGNIGGGGGAGGLRTSVPGGSGGGGSSEPTLLVSPGSYPVVIGAGAARTWATQDGANNPIPGTPTSFGPITSQGGGGGGGGAGPGGAGGPGGSGGGASGYAANNNPGTGNRTPGNSPVPTQGYSGGSSGSSWRGAGGGGAGGGGTAGTSGKHGGPGLLVSIIPSPPSINSGTGYYWAGGGGGGYHPSGEAGGNGGLGGGGGGGTDNGSSHGSGGTGGLNDGIAGGVRVDPSPYGYSGGDAGQSTGSGGGATSHNGGQNYLFSGAGGSGIVVVRYTLPASTGTARATGGAISYYGGQTIHTFTSSGTFQTLSNWSATNVEYVLVGGGGAGGNGTDHGCGGGAGGYRTGTIPLGAHPISYTITVAAGGSSLPGINDAAGLPGSWSQFGPVYVGGGSGGNGYASNASGPLASPQGSDGGSGGGETYGPDSRPSAGSYGNLGGTSSSTSPGYGSGGGGGAGGVGANGTPTVGGAGGIGVQVPTTFRNPLVAPSDTSTPRSPERGGGLGTPGPGGSYYLAGGGGGSVFTLEGTPAANAGAGGAGGGGAAYPGPGTAYSGVTNTGGGGGGGERTGTPIGPGGRGGSGIVLIAYPT